MTEDLPLEIGSASADVGDSIQYLGLLQLGLSLRGSFDRF